MLPPAALQDRRKDPLKLRAALLDATAAIIAEQGLARVTVDAVARRAGVTKGGLFHHFPSKQALIDGVADRMIATADETVDAQMAVDTEPRGRFTRALMNCVSRQDADAEIASARVLCLALLADPALQERWARWIAGRLERHADTDGGTSCAIVRLACDGLWLSSLQGSGNAQPLDPAVKAAMLAMTRDGP